MRQPKQQKIPSLNDCLEIGPKLQNLLWDILVRNQFKPICLCADIQKAFLQIRIRESERDALCFLWLRDIRKERIEILRFTRLVFGLNQSPFVLEATLREHLSKYESICPEIVNEIITSMYVDDLISGGFSREVLELKPIFTQIFQAGGFKLHKFHSNCELESEEVNIKTSEESPEVIIKGDCNDTTYAKLGIQPLETKILGLLWDKKEDSVAIEIPSNKAKHTKREILSKLASIYHPLGLISPVHLRGKVVYRELCESKLPWDKIIPNQVIQVWEKCESTLPSKMKVPRSIPSPDTPLNAIDIHVFADFSIIGTCAAAYAVTHQSGHVNQHLIATKSRLAKQNMSIPRFELIAVHMASNLAENIKSTLTNYNIRDIHGWTDSTVVLHWLKGKGDYKQFVLNRINKINAKAYITWRHVPSNQIPADIGSRGVYGKRIPELWWTEPTWLQQTEQWPPQPRIMASDESEKEAKAIKTLLATSITIDHGEDECDSLLLKHSLWKFIRITCWISRFFNNCRRTRGH